jgi:uncharacterized protein (DUF1330 family)
MSAYAISETEVLDEALAERYRSLAQASIVRYGGRYLVRGAAVEVLEGDWPPRRRVVVVEFPTLERARQWYASPEYAEALALRERALARRVVLVDGVSQR